MIIILTLKATKTNLSICVCVCVLQVGQVGLAKGVAAVEMRCVWIKKKESKSYRLGKLHIWMQSLLQSLVQQLPDGLLNLITRQRNSHPTFTHTASAEIKPDVHCPQIASVQQRGLLGP